MAGFGELDWHPGNAVEVELMNALIDGARQTFCQLICAQPLYLPAFADDEAAGPTPTGVRQGFLTWELLGETYLLVFTSIEGLARAVGQAVDRYTVTDFAELCAKWPDPSWRLGVNAGTPVDGWFTLDALAAGAAGTTSVPALPDLSTPATAADPEVDAALDDYLADLLDGDVLVPLAARPARDSAGVRAEDFPWLVDVDGSSAVLSVFSTPEAFALAYPQEVTAQWVAFRLLVAAWPGEEFALRVDPGAPAGFTVAGPDIPALLLWGGSPPGDGRE